MSKGNWREFDDCEASTKGVSGKTSSRKTSRKIRVQKLKAGKKGKTVTQITGLELESEEAIVLLKELKTKIGTGGAYKDGVFELQGDHVTSLLSELTQKGYQPKKSGG